MSVCNSCSQYELSQDDWFCKYCGERRHDCPNCGGELGNKECASCGHSRYGPCMECEELTPANKSVCENCGYNEGAAMESRANKFVGVGVALGLLGGLLILGIVAGGIIGSIAGSIAVLAGIVIGGLGLAEKGSSSVDSPVALYIGEKNNLSDDYAKDAADTVVDAAGTAASVGADAIESYDQHKQEKEERKQKRQQQQRDQRIKAKRESITESVQEAKNSHVSVLWKMNCERCGLPWATTQSKKIARSDDFETIGFTVINEKEWEFIQDRVQIQCGAPDCNHTARFTKDSLWTP